MAGEVNGTDKFLAIDDGAGGFNQIGGEISATLTMNNQVIEITNKSAGDFAAYLSGEGIKNATISGEYRFNSDSAFADLLAAFDTGAATDFLYGNGTVGNAITAIVTNVTKTSNQGEAVTASVSLQVTGTFAATEA